MRSRSSARSICRNGTHCITYARWRIHLVSVPWTHGIWMTTTIYWHQAQGRPLGWATQRPKCCSYWNVPAGRPTKNTPTYTHLAVHPYLQQLNKWFSELTELILETIFFSSDPSLFEGKKQVSIEINGSFIKVRIKESISKEDFQGR